MCTCMGWWIPDEAKNNSPWEASDFTDCLNTNHVWHRAGCDKLDSNSDPRKKQQGNVAVSQFCGLNLTGRTCFQIRLWL